MIGFSIRSEVPGLVQLQPGHLVQLQRGSYMVESVNECCARCVPVDRTRVTVKAKAGDENGDVEFEVPGRPMSIASRAEPEVVVGIDKDLLAEQLARREEKMVRAAKQTKNTVDERNSNSMAKFKKSNKTKTPPKDKTKARGGLAAEVAEIKAEDAKAITTTDGTGTDSPEQKPKRTRKAKPEGETFERKPRVGKSSGPSAASR